jgi:hypothetical protein
MTMTILYRHPIPRPPAYHVRNTTHNQRRRLPHPITTSKREYLVLRIPKRIKQQLLLGIHPPKQLTASLMIPTPYLIPHTKIQYTIVMMLPTGYSQLQLQSP